MVAERFVHENIAHGPKKLVRAPIRIAKNAISKLRTYKFGVPLNCAQEWYDTIAIFAKKEYSQAEKKRHLKNLRKAFEVGRPIPGAVHKQDDDDDDDGDGAESIRSSESSIVQDANEEDESSEKEHYDVEVEDHRTIADHQPSNIHYNPW